MEANDYARYERSRRQLWNPTQLIGKIERVEFLGMTVNGNPMHKVSIITPDNEIWIKRVSNDAMLSYAIGNAEYRDKWHTFYLTRAGRIAYARII